MLTALSRCMKNYLGIKRTLEDRIETEFRRLTTAELRADADAVKLHKNNYEFYKAELQALTDAVKAAKIKTGAI